MNKRIKKKHGYDAQMNNAPVVNAFPRWRRVVRLQNAELRGLVRRIERGEEPLNEYNNLEELFDSLSI